MTRLDAERIAWIAGSAGLAGAAAGWLLAPAAFPHAWLAALTAWLGWPLGCVGLLLVHALTGGRWGYAIRPQLVAGMRTALLLPPAAIPLLIELRTLYPWARPDVAAHLGNRFYLNQQFFLGRGAVYLIVWLGLAGLILRALRQDIPEARLARIAPAGLILLAITVTFAAIDTTMSLDPRFASSAYGLIAIAEMGLLALSVSIFAAVIGEPPDDTTLRDLGRLLLALLILWAYLDFMQVLIVWQSDLPNEASWYVVRSRGGWGIAAAWVAGCHFVLPFFALLSPRLQGSPRGIACVTALLILSEVVRCWWLVVPASGRNFGLVDVLAMLGLIGIAAALALRAPLLPGFPEVVRRHV
ncbi:MAG: hypothetical protein M3178_17295 [Pseudomonadota bacterium]|nr:hypothetical protein [Pseudomonadota bacterium]